MTAEQFGTWEDAVRWLREQPDQQALVRDCYFDSPLIGAADRYWKSEEWKAVRALLPRQPGSVLDLGAGNGIASYALARDGWRVTALEPDSSALVGAAAIRSLAAEARTEIDVVEEWGESIPAADASFDAVFARQVLHHARDLSQLCREIRRVLKPHGVLLAVRDHVISGPGQLPAFFEKHPLHARYGGENAYTLQEYRRALEGAGLVVQKVLGPFDSVINMAPQTPATLQAEVRRRVAALPGGNLFAAPIGSPAVFGRMLRLLALVDRRPGRLYSFLCTAGHV